MRLIVLIIAAMAGVAHARAPAVISVEAIDRAIEDALGHPAGSPGGAAHRIDPRLRLAVCPVALSVEQNGGDAVDIRCPAVGWRLRVPILNDGSLAATKQPAIKRGDSIQIIARGSGFEVTTPGIALEQAAVGQALRVKSLTNGAILHAKAAKPGSAVVND